MPCRYVLLLALAPLLLAGCGAGLKEEGRLPVSNPLGRGVGDSIEMTVGTFPNGRNGAPDTKLARASYTGTFSNVASDVTIGDVRRFIISQRLQSASVNVPGGAPLPETITLNNFRLNATFSDNLAQVQFNVSMTGTVTLTRITGNAYAVTVQGAGNDPCLEASVDTGNLNTLASIVTQGGDNTVVVLLTANVTSNPGLPDGTIITFVTGLGTGTLEL